MVYSKVPSQQRLSQVQVCVSMRLVCQYVFHKSATYIVLLTYHQQRDGRVYYLESRPSGKTMLVEVVNGEFRDVLPEKFNVQSR